MDTDYMASRFDHLVLGNVKRGVVIYSCPVCGAKTRAEGAGMEPACTGPTWRDDHPMTPMVRVGIDRERLR